MVEDALFDIRNIYFGLMHVITLIKQGSDESSRLLSDIEENIIRLRRGFGLESAKVYTGKSLKEYVEFATETIQKIRSGNYSGCGLNRLSSEISDKLEKMPCLSQIEDFGSGFAFSYS